MARVKPKYVNAGAYGCVFEPHLPCELGVSSKDPRAKATIGKIMSDANEAKIEWEANELVRKVDPKNDFTVKAHGVCKRYQLSQVDAHELEKCVLLKDGTSGQNGVQIVYEHGGKTLTEFLMNYEHTYMPMDVFVRLFFKFGNLFYGAMLLNNSQSIHFDIKSENVLIDDDMNLKLIDFGLLTRHHELEKNELIAFSYRYFPPELRIYSHKTRSTPKELTPSEVLEEYMNDGGYDFIEKFQLFDPKDDIEKCFALPAETLMTFTKRRVDVFALGWLLSLVGFCTNGMEDPKFTADIKFPIFTFIRNTARFHPEHRSSPEEAYAYHKMICSYFANSNVLHNKRLSALRPSEEDKDESKNN